MVVVAYILLFFVAQVGFLLGCYIGQLVSLVLFWMPGSFGVAMRAVVAGAVGAGLGVLTAFGILLLFHLPMTWIAAYCWIILPFYNDRKKYHELTSLRKSLLQRVDEESRKKVEEDGLMNPIALGYAPFGYVIGATIVTLILMQR